MLRCPGHSQLGLRCWRGSRRLGHKLVSFAEKHPALPKIWEGRCQMAAVSLLTSPLITARANKKSKVNQTATHLPPPLPAGKTLDMGIVPGWGVWEMLGWEKAASHPLLPQGLWESTAPPYSSEGPPSTLATGCCGMWGSRAASRSMVGKLAWGPGGSWWSWHGNHAPVPCRDMAPVHTWVTCVLRTHKVNYYATCRRYFATNTNLLFFPYAPIWSNFSS